MSNEPIMPKTFDPDPIKWQETDSSYLKRDTSLCAPFSTRVELQSVLAERTYAAVTTNAGMLDKKLACPGTNNALF